MLAGPTWHAPLSTADERAAAFYLEGLDRHLAILPGAARSFDNAVRADPTFAAAAAALAVTASGVGELALARRSLAAARSLAETAPEQVQSQIGCIDAFLTRSSGDALHAAGAHLRQFPADVFVLSLTLQSLHGSGRRTRRQEALGLLDRALAAGCDHYAVPSMRSVIAADLGDLDRARSDAEEGLGGNDRSAHAAHGMAHVFYETSDHEAGLAWLSEWTKDFDPNASGVHLSWHLALHELGLGDLDAVVARYERAIRPFSASTLFVDAVDILWRARLTGADDTARHFAELRSIVPSVDTVRSTTLGLLQAVVVLAGDRDADALRAAVEHLGLVGSDPVARAGVLPIAEGLLAVVEGRLRDAVRSLESVDGAIVALSASNAQLDAVSRTLLWCYERVGSRPSPAVFLVARLAAGSSARATGTADVGRPPTIVRRGLARIRTSHRPSPACGALSR